MGKWESVVEVDGRLSQWGGVVHVLVGREHVLIEDSRWKGAGRC